MGVAQAANRLSQSLGYRQYLLQVIGSMQIQPVRDRSTLTVLTAAGYGAAVGLAIAVTLLARRRRGRSPVATVESPSDAPRSSELTRAR